MAQYRPAYTEGEPYRSALEQLIEEGYPPYWHCEAIGKMWYAFVEQNAPVNIR